MSKSYWKPVDGLPNEAETEVNEDHALPVGLYWGADQFAGSEVVNPDHPLPVQVFQPVTTRQRIIDTGPIEIPGITLADAFDAADAMGTIFSVTVPKAGAIVQALFHDLDDEGTNHVVHIFRRKPATQPASDAVLDYTDADNLLYRGRIRFLTATIAVQDLTSNQIGFSHTADVPFWFEVGDERKLWMQAQALGTDNIASLNVPKVSFIIQVFED